jgi:hypothetical protein
MQWVGRHPQLPIHQPMGPVGEPQQLQALVAAVTQDTGAAPWLQPELLAHQRGAAADGALVHRQGTGSLGLRSGEFQQVEHMQVLQVLQGLGWGVGRELAS